MLKNALIIFVKNPEKGKVKTRLAKTIGDDRALEVYKQLLSHTRHVALNTDVDRLLFYNQSINEKDDWNSNSFKKFVQADGDLGNKMQYAFSTAFELGYESVTIIGSDCAQLTPKIINTAFQDLVEKDFVIGPALDGGYYLLGMNQLHEKVFSDKNWSTETVFSDTINDIESMNKSYSELQTLSDVDHEKDLDALREIA